MTPLMQAVITAFRDHSGFLGPLMAQKDIEAGLTAVLALHDAAKKPDLEAGDWFYPNDDMTTDNYYDSIENALEQMETDEPAMISRAMELPPVYAVQLLKDGTENTWTYRLFPTYAEAESFQATLKDGKPIVAE